jgi:hypothetical protein
MKLNNTIYTDRNEKGAALVLALMTLALMLALTLGISLTAISEMGVSSTYGTQTIALQAAEAGLNHAASLISNYEEANFTQLLSRRPTPLSTDYITGNNPFITANAAYFAPGVVMIDMEDAQRGFQLRDGVTGALVADAYYRVSVIDDEPTTSTALPRVPNFTPGSTYREVVAPNAFDPNIDKNNRMVIYSTGTYANASVTLEGWVAFLPYPAFSANDDINISGSSDIRGLYGGVHSNSDLIANGNGWWVEQTATASGSLVGDFTGNVGGFYGGNQSRLDIPPIVTTEPLTTSGPKTTPRLQDFLIRQADRLLIDPAYATGAHHFFNNGNGNPGTRRLAALSDRINVPYGMLAAALDTDGDSGNDVDQDDEAALEITRDSNGNATSVTRLDMDDTGWDYSGGSNASWGILTNNNGLQAGGHTWYVIGVDNYNGGPASTTNPAAKNGGNVKLTGNVGSSGNPLQISIFTTGSIEISGTPNMRANLSALKTPLLPPFVKIDMLMAAVQDIKINGDVSASISFTGISYAGEQVELSGNGSINGQVISFSNPHVSGTPVSANGITGSFDLTLNDGNSIGRIKLFSWRQIKK